MKTPQPSSLPWYRWLNSHHVVRLLETVQDLIVIGLCIGLFSFMVLQLREMVLSLLPPLQFQTVTSDILFLLILVELFRLLIIYLQEHRVSIGVAVEVSIVSVLREIIVRGVLETPWSQVLVACLFLLVLGALLIIRVWIPPTFDGINPEQFISQRHRSRHPSQEPEHQPLSSDTMSHPQNSKSSVSNLLTEQIN
ncbi:phosphate-starvation-inducible PsiE family protein [Spirulina major]|uniref:phosphate-starvation-inducible PsiE family protein n=1 Tax=Spirulina major TaxID=270636 RepID=UPI0009FD3E9B|nr:phosphate-starvation-inducible PsiE family protein [Spirulina major]